MAWLLGLYRAVLRSWMAWAGGLTIEGQPSPFAAAMAWRTAADAVIPTAGGSECNGIAANAPQRMQSNRIESAKGAAKGARLSAWMDSCATSRPRWTTLI